MVGVPRALCGSQLGDPGLLGQEGKQFLHQKIQTGGLFSGASTIWKPLNVTCDKPTEYGANVLCELWKEEGADALLHVWTESFHVNLP